MDNSLIIKELINNRKILSEILKQIKINNIGSSRYEDQHIELQRKLNSFQTPVGHFLIYSKENKSVRCQDCSAESKTATSKEEFDNEFSKCVRR